MSKNSPIVKMLQPSQIELTSQTLTCDKRSKSKRLTLPKEWLERAGMKDWDGIYLRLVCLDPEKQRYRIEIVSQTQFNQPDLAKQE